MDVSSHKNYEQSYHGTLEQLFHSSESLQIFGYLQARSYFFLPIFTLTKYKTYSFVHVLKTIGT